MNKIITLSTGKTSAFILLFVSMRTYARKYDWHLYDILDTIKIYLCDNFKSIRNIGYTLIFSKYLDQIVIYLHHKFIFLFTFTPTPFYTIARYRFTYTLMIKYYNG